MDKAGTALAYCLPIVLIALGLLVIFKLRGRARYGRVTSRVAGVYLALPVIAVIILLILAISGTASTIVPFLTALILLPLAMLALRIALANRP